MIALILLTAWQISIVGEEPFGGVVPPSVFPRNGTCENSSGFVNVDWINFLQEPIVRISVDGNEAIFEIERDHLKRWEDVDPNSFSVWYMRHFLSEELGPDYHDMDLILTFAELDHHTYLHWRESYVNHIYRQGLVDVETGQPIHFCVGSGGSTSLH
jgi:hypothetical protein